MWRMATKFDTDGINEYLVLSLYSSCESKSVTSRNARKTNSKKTAVPSLAYALKISQIKHYSCIHCQFERPPLIYDCKISIILSNHARHFQSQYCHKKAITIF